jgi:hypothetical protein
MTITELECQFSWLIGYIEYINQLMRDALR